MNLKCLIGSGAVISGLAFAIIYNTSNTMPIMTAVARFPSNPERVITLQVGSLRLRAENKYLVFPWPGDASPDKERAFIMKTQPRFASNIANQYQAASLSFDLPDLSPPTFKKNVRLIVELEYLPIFRPRNMTVQEMANKSSRATLTARFPSMDTVNYAAFEVDGQYRFVSKSGRTPEAADCTISQNSYGKRDDDCWTVVPFMTEPWRRDAAGNYPYALSITFPLAQIDNLPQITDLINKKISSMLVPPGFP